MDTNTLTAPSDIGDAQQTAISVLSSAFENVAKGAAIRADAPRLFFPNGIERISVTVNVASIQIAVEIAGAAGIKHTLNGQAQLAPETPLLPA